MRQHLRKISVTLALVTTTAVTIAVTTTGTMVAGAATRSRSGAVHAQLVDAPHVAANTGAAAGLGLTGPTVMAAVVGLMAVLAFGFLVVTFIRRRATAVA